MQSTRMFEIIQMLRSAPRPLRAQDMAEALEVTRRTVYRDIAALQAMRVPIEGAAGIGYVMRAGYDLPPVNFDADEAEAIVVGLSLIARTGDRALEQAARRAARKLSEATGQGAALYASGWGAVAPAAVDLGDIRRAIRDEAVLLLEYADASGAVTRRRVKPLALIYYAEVTVLAAWCTLRQDFRHFRADRMQSCATLDETYAGEGAGLRQAWAGLHARDLV